MAAATCARCGAWTSAATGYCTVCRQPLAGSQTHAATAPAPPAWGTAPYVGLPPQYAGPPYAVPPGYAPPPPGAAPLVYGYPGYAPAYIPMVPVPYAVAFAQEAAGTRIAAGVLDILLVVGVWLALFFFVYPSLFAFPSAFAIRIPITLTWFLGYYGVMDGFAGGTLGKRAVGLTLVNKDLTPIRPSQGFLRSLEIFLWMVAGGIILLLVQHSMVQNGGQGVGDKLAGCYLVPRSRVAQVAPRSR